MITFACHACHKTFSVKEELAGKKGKCPACGQMVVIPASVAQRQPPPPREPDASPDQQAQPSQIDASPAPTHPSCNLDATHGPRSTANPEAALTDFLTPPQADDELGRLGKYRILKILGHGGMGVVFKAEDPRLKRLVALKAMLPIVAASASDGQRFLREAQAMAAVEHDHIVRVYQIDEECGAPFMAMEFLKGERLEERLKRSAKLPLADVLRIGREIASGLAAAHAKGLIHRDVKPANLWLEAPGDRVKILDFGLARPAGDDAHLTQEGAIVGTPAYMAPEQGRGETVDARSDLFSLGVVLYRLCSGRQPFKGKDAVSTLMAVAMEEPTPPRKLDADVPPELSDLVMQLLHKAPERRPASADAVVERLRILEKQLTLQVEAEAPTVVFPGGTRRRRIPEGRRRRLPLVLTAVLLLVALIGGGAAALVRIQTEQGDYVVETDDPDFSFRVSKGAVTLEDRKTKRNYALKVVDAKKAAGEYELEVADAAADLTFKTRTFTIKRGEQVALKAWFERKQAVVVKEPRATLDDAWSKLVAAMPAAKQVEAVAARLKELNPDFDGKLTHKIEDGAVTQLQFVADKVADLSPVRALRGLRKLTCNGSKGMGKLSDLTPLKGMNLTALECSNTKVDDLSPLENMKLTFLRCSFTLVSDLSPLRNMKLTLLRCSGTKVTDLSPLRNMKLTSVFCTSTGVTDLSPLRGMPLTEIRCNSTRVTDLSPLRGMPLEALWCDFKPERDAEILRAIKTLETINGKSVKAFWKEVDAGKREKKP